MAKFYLDRFGQRITLFLTNKNVLTWYQRALNWEYSRLLFLEKLRTFVRSIVCSIDFKDLIFLTGELVDTCIEYEVEAIYLRTTKIFQLSQGIKLKDMDLNQVIGFRYLRCFQESLVKETNMSLEQIFNCCDELVRQGSLASQFQLISEKRQQIKPSRVMLGESAELNIKHKEEVNEIQHTPIEYLESILLPKLMMAINQQQDYFAMPLLANLQILRLFN